MLTHRRGYQRFTTSHKINTDSWPQDATADFEADPDSVGQVKYAVRSACFFWVTHSLYSLADQSGTQDVVDSISKAINPGLFEEKPNLMKSESIDGRRGNFFRNPQMGRPFVKPASMAVILMAIVIAPNIATVEAADYPDSMSLCHHGEVEYFSCKLQDSNKIASVCAAGNSSPDHGYVQYRFGTHGSIEYNYPGELTPPRGKISIVDVSRLPDGLGSHLKFTNGSYTYVISNALVPGEVYVAKNGKLIFDKICEGRTYIPFGSAVRRGLEYGVENSVDELDQHGK